MSATLVRARRLGRDVARVACVLGLLAAFAHASSAALVPASAAERSTTASYEDYARRVARARSEARALEPETATAEAADELATNVGELLPDGERVRVGGDDAVEVDASVLGGLLTGVRSAETGTERAEALERLRGHIESLYASTGGGRAASGEEVPEDRAALQELLDRRTSDGGTTFGERLAEIWQRAIAAVGRWFGENLSPEQSAALSETVQVALIVVLALVLAYVLFRFLVSWRTGVAGGEVAGEIDEGRPVVAAAEGLPADALAYAEELAAAGEYRAAVRALFGGAARRLVEAGVLAQTRTRTDAELLAEVAPAAPRAHHPLAELTGAFERAWYGHSDPGAQGFARARELYGAVVGAVAA